MDDDRSEPVTRLGPDSGGRMPGEPGVRVYHWEWGPGRGAPAGPALDRDLPAGVRWAAAHPAGVPRVRGGSARCVVLAVGLAFLVKWADRPRHGLALRRRDHHRARRARAAQCGRHRGQRPEHVQPRASPSCSSPRSGPRPAAAGAGSSGSAVCSRWSVASTSPARHSPATPADHPRRPRPVPDSSATGWAGAPGWRSATETPGGRPGSDCRSSDGRSLDRLGQDLRDPLELGIGDDERRPEQDRVAVDAVGVAGPRVERGRRARGRPGRRLGDPGGARERRPRLPIGDELDPDQQAAATDLTDRRVPAEAVPERARAAARP